LSIGNRSNLALLTGFPLVNAPLSMRIAPSPSVSAQSGASHPHASRYPLVAVVPCQIVGHIPALADDLVGRQGFRLILQSWSYSDRCWPSF
jgi:hypothetical protein